MLNAISSFFSTQGFMPHGMCLFWKPSVLWTLVISNVWIALSYLLIPIILMIVYLKRKDIKYTWVFLLFAAFILLCGLTHALHVITYWKPIYGVQGVADGLTAVVSMLTAIVLWRLVPDILKIPTPQALQASEERYKTLIDNVQNGICTFNEGYKINFINSAGCKILNKAEDKILGQDVRSYFNLDIAWAEQENANKHHECIINTSEKLKIIDLQCTTIKHEDQDTQEYLASFTDITIFKDISVWENNPTDVIASAKKTRSRILESQKMESLGKFAGGIAHEFNNILAIIKGSLELSNELVTTENEKLSQQLSIAEKAADNAKDIIKQILLFARESSANSDLQRLNINDALNNLSTLNKAVLGPHINVNMTFAKNLWDIQANYSQILQIFTNLMTNSSYAIVENGDINIKTENVNIETELHADGKNLSPGEYVKITFADTGSGIAPENLKNIFTPFYSTKPVGKGTGLGLSVVYGIITNHHGEIFVQSELGRGTTLTLYFPKATDTNEKQQITTKANKLRSKQNNLNNKHVLIVDDEELLCEIFSAYLKSCAAKVIVANNGISGLEKFNANQQQLSLIVLDTTMPKLDGISVYKEIRKSSNIPILFISGHDAKAKLAEILKADANATWLSKPFDKQELIDNCNELLR